MATKPKTPQTEQMLVRVIALHPIRHDGVDYAEQDVVELEKADAEALVSGGWVEMAPE